MYTPTEVDGTIPDAAGAIPDLEALLTSDEEEEELPQAPATPPVEFSVNQAIMKAFSEFGTSLPEFWAEPAQRWKAIIERLYRAQARLQHPDRNQKNKKEAHQKMIRLGCHKEVLLQFLQDWSQLQRLLRRHLPTCVCVRCHDLFQRMTRCRFCLGTESKKGHQNCGLKKEASYYRRNHPNWYPTLLRYQAHGDDTGEARKKADMDRKLQEGRQKTAEKLEKIRRKREAEEEQILFHQHLAEALQKTEMEVISEWERETGLKASASTIQACFFVSCLHVKAFFGFFTCLQNVYAGRTVGPKQLQDPLEEWVRVLQQAS